MPTGRPLKLRVSTCLEVARVNELADIRAHFLAFEVVASLESRIASVRYHHDLGQYAELSIQAEQHREMYHLRLRD